MKELTEAIDGEASFAHPFQRCPPISEVPPSTVKNFVTSSSCSMEGAETVPTVLGVAQF